MGIPILKKKHRNSFLQIDIIVILNIDIYFKINWDNHDPTIDNLIPQLTKNCEHLQLTRS